MWNVSYSKSYNLVYYSCVIDGKYNGNILLKHWAMIFVAHLQRQAICTRKAGNNEFYVNS